MNNSEKEYDHEALKALAFYHNKMIEAARDGMDHMITFWRGAITGTKRMTDDKRIRKLADRIDDRTSDYHETARENPTQW